MILIWTVLVYSLTLLRLSQALVDFLYLLFEQLGASCVIWHDFAIDAAPRLKIVNSKVVFNLLVQLNVAVIIIVLHDRLPSPRYNCLIAQLTVVYEVFLRLHISVSSFHGARKLLLVHLAFVRTDAAGAIYLQRI